MPRAKPRYDSDGSWKTRNFSSEEWDALSARLRSNLRPFYPDKQAVEDPTFGHPADAWSNYLLSESDSAVSMILWLRRRLTNEELRAEREDLLRTLTKAVQGLSTVSHDLDIMLGNDADVLGTRDKLKDLIARLEASDATIAGLPKAKTLREAQHDAAVEMAIRALRVVKGAGGTVAATADTYLGYVSDAVRVLKIIGDELGLYLDESTWKGVIIEAKKAAPDLGS